MMNDEIYDVTIIGGGPVGMFAGFYAGLREAKVQIIESLPEFGGQVRALYPEKTILDVPGFAGISGQALIEQLEEQLNLVQTDQRLNETVEDVIQETDETFTIKTNQRITKSRGVMIATGAGAFEPRTLRAENAETFRDQKLFYSVPQLDKFKNHEVMVAGGGDSAIDMALMLNQVAKKVYLVHRREEFKGLEHMVTQLKNSNIELMTPYLIKKLAEQNNQLLVTAKKVKSDDQFETKIVDELIVNYGFVSNNKALKKWSIQPELEHNLIVVDGFMQTSLQNVFAIGDPISYPSKQDLIANGFAEASIAINGLLKQIRPNDRGPVHSTGINLK